MTSKSTSSRPRYTARVVRLSAPVSSTQVCSSTASTTPTAGLMNPNHYLAVAISYVFTHRSRWSTEAAVGKTVVSSGFIDRVTAGLGRRLITWNFCADCQLKR